MMRGLVSGSIWGLVVGLVVAAVASLVSDLPGTAPPDADVVEVPAGSEFEERREDVAAVLPEADAAPEVEAPVVEAPSVPEAPTLGAEVTAPGDAPDVGTVDAEIAAPEGGEAGVAAESEAPVLTTPQAAVPASPLSENDVSISTDPAQPVEPSVPDVAAGGEEVTPVEPSETPPRDIDVAVTPEAPEVPSPEAAPDVVADAPDTAESSVAEPAPDVVDPAIVPEDNGAESAAAPPQPGLGNRETGVTTNRLPSIAIEGAPQTAPESDVAASDLPPIEAFAQTFENPNGLPKLSLVLIDQGNTAGQLAALASLEMPLTFVVDATREDAAATMALYRDAGHEVVAGVGLPDGVQPSDVEVILTGAFQAMPETVALLDGTGSGFGGNREIAAQVSESLIASGRGLLTYDVGLGTALRVAEGAGVPVASVFRDLDGDGQNATVIRRFLDQAAFRAGQEGAVVLLGRMRAETISALLIWEQQARAQTVALAPLSAVLVDR